MTSKRIEEIASLWIRYSNIKSVNSLQTTLQKIGSGPANPDWAPISFRYSPYLIKVKDAVVYATSSLAALILPFIVESDVWIETFCPTHGTSISLWVTRDGVTACSPAHCVLSVVIPQELGCDSNANPSSTIHTAGQLNRFFSSQAAATAWLVAYPEALILPVNDAWRFAALIHDNFSHESK